MIVRAQQTTVHQNGVNSSLGKLSSAFSGDKVVQTIQLSGNATWHAGSLEDSGIVNLTASTDGSSQMQLTLNNLGNKSETQVGNGSSAVCKWAGADGLPKEVDALNCWKPVLWFMPAFSLQASLLPSYMQVADLGIGTVGKSATEYRHIQCKLLFSDLPESLTEEAALQSTSDIGLDIESQLPAVLSYSVHPDSGALPPINIEIRYSNYRLVDGTQIPFSIQRYVNGSLQLDIVISSAQIG
jgi:hypothetical protein